MTARPAPRRAPRLAYAALALALGACRKAADAAPEKSDPAPAAKTAAGDSAAGDSAGKPDAGAGGDEGGASKAVVPARTAVAEQRPFADHLSAIGTVVGRPGHVASLSAPAAGRVARVLVVPGQRVTAGQPLVALDQVPFVTAAQSADAALANAERARERARRLVEAGIAPRKDLDQSTADLAQARAAALTAGRARQLATLRSPIAGVVTRLGAVLGAAVDPAAPLVEVADPGAVDVLLTVTPAGAARVRAGAAVALRAGQGADAEALGTGRVAGVAAAIDTVSRGVTVRVVPSGAGRPLRIGETVEGAITVGTRAAAVVVPQDALLPEGEGYKVFVVGDSGVVRSRPVTVGGRADGVAEITQGLRAGERVATAGAFGLEDGARVAGLTTSAASAPAKPVATPARTP